MTPQALHHNPAQRPGLVLHYQCCDYAPLQSRPPCREPPTRGWKLLPPETGPAPGAGSMAMGTTHPQPPLFPVVYVPTVSHWILTGMFLPTQDLFRDFHGLAHPP